jgi:hypothetical protein
MLDFLSVGLAAGSNPNTNDPGEAQIAVPPKIKLYSSTQHRRFLLLQFQKQKVLQQVFYSTTDKFYGSAAAPLIQKHPNP